MYLDKLIFPEADSVQYVSTFIATISWMSSYVLGKVLPYQPYLNAVLE